MMLFQPADCPKVRKFTQWTRSLGCLLVAGPMVVGCAGGWDRDSQTAAKSNGGLSSGRPEQIHSPVNLTHPVQQVHFKADSIGAESGNERESSFDRFIVAVPDSADHESNLQSLVATAVQSHPRILAVRQRVAALSNRIPQVTALEDPSFGNVFWPIQDQALQTAGGRVGYQFLLAQKVPWPTKLDARGAIARREVQVALAEVAVAEREIIEAVHLAYYELWLAGELIRIVEDNKDLVTDLITVSEARYRTGGSQQDVLRAELEGDKLADQLIDLQKQMEQARADLGTLVRQPMEWMPGAIDQLDVSSVVPQLELLVASAEQCNPELRGLAAEIARDRDKLSLACLQQYPDFQLGVGYSIIDDNTNAISPVANGRDNINFTLGLTLPVWRDKISAAKREAAYQRGSSIHRLEAERDRLRGQLRRQVAAAYAANEQLQLFKERLIPRTEQTLKIAIADYQGEKADFTDLVDIYRELLSYQVQVARTKAVLASTLAQIEKSVGCELDSAH
jgi:outer membrane protein TolC